MPFQGRSANVSFEVGVTEPQQLTQFMKGYFGVQISKMEIALTLLKPVDVEKLYQLTVYIFTLYNQFINCVHRFFFG